MSGEEMRAVRLNRGFSRRALAREIDVPEQTLRRLERGLGIRPHYAKRIADFYGCKVTDLMEPEPKAAA